MKEKINFWVIVSLILAILLVSVITYICITKYKEAKESEKQDIFNLGAQYGYESAVLEIMQKAGNCEKVSLFAGNETIELANVAC